MGKKCQLDLPVFFTLSYVSQTQWKWLYEKRERGFERISNFKRMYIYTQKKDWTDLKKIICLTGFLIQTKDLFELNNICFIQTK